MGGRGSRSAGQAQQTGAGGGAPSPQQQSIANQAPSPANTPVVPDAIGRLSQMSDDQLAQLVVNSRSVDMPNHLSDVDDATQKFVYAAGLNEKPQVLDTAAFNQYMAQNNIPQSQVLARSVNGANYTVNGTTIRLQPSQVTAMIKDGSLNYIGGKYGGQVHGAGTYFDMNGGRPTGYGGGATALAVLSKNARVVNESRLPAMAQTFAQNNPKFARAVGRYSNRTESIYALAMGYNVIRAGSYHNVLDRAALVMRADDY